MNSVRVGLCLLVWNELKGCEYDIPTLPFGEFHEIFALDGGSTDGTVEFLKQQGIPVVTQKKRGYNSAYIEAFEHTKCDALVVFHPKGTVESASLTHLVEALKSGHDLVIASRNIKGGQNEEDSEFLKPRKWFVLALGALSGLLWWRGDGPMVLDVLHGYRGMRRDAFFAMDPIPEGLSMDLQMVVRSYRMKMRRLEVPVRESVRLEGETHFKAFPTGKRLLQYLWFELGRAKPAKFESLQVAYEEADRARSVGV